MRFVAECPGPKSKPNILFVLFDDPGWGQPKSYNAQSVLRTPNLGRLVQEGMRFTDAHSAAAVCTPTRYSVITGRYPSRIGQFGVMTTFSEPIIPASRKPHLHDRVHRQMAPWHELGGRHARQ